MSNKIKFLETGARASALDFVDSYKEGFLYKHGFKRYQVLDRGIECHLLTVKTKYGEMVIGLDTMLTYIGHNVWDAREE